MLNKKGNISFGNGYRWNGNVLLGKCFPFCRRYAHTDLSPGFIPIAPGTPCDIRRVLRQAPGVQQRSGPDSQGGPTRAGFAAPPGAWNPAIIRERLRGVNPATTFGIFFAPTSRGPRCCSPDPPSDAPTPSRSAPSPGGCNRNDKQYRPSPLPPP